LCKRCTAVYCESRDNAVMSYCITARFFIHGRFFKRHFVHTVITFEKLYCRIKHNSRVGDSLAYKIIYMAEKITFKRLYRIISEETVHSVFNDNELKVFIQTEGICRSLH
jgi:hypothetical protein